MPSDPPVPEGTARIDETFAFNVREYREAEGVSQEELARRMTDRGFGFSQATIWKIEQNKRPVRIGEAVALAEALGVRAWRDLTEDPERFRHGTRIDRANRAVANASEMLQAAAKEYLDAQLNLAFSVREATDAGHAVPDLWKSNLGVPAEQVVLRARLEDEHADQDAERIDKAIRQVVTALHEHGYPAVFDPADFEFDPPRAT